MYNDGDGGGKLYITWNLNWHLRRRSRLCISKDAFNRRTRRRKYQARRLENFFDCMAFLYVFVAKILLFYYSLLSLSLLLLLLLLLFYYYLFCFRAKTIDNSLLSVITYAYVYRHPIPLILLTPCCVVSWEVTQWFRHIFADIPQYLIWSTMVEMHVHTIVHTYRHVNGNLFSQVILSQQLKYISIGLTHMHINWRIKILHRRVYYSLYRKMLGIL